MTTNTVSEDEALQALGVDKKYGFLTKYGQQTGIFVAANLEIARTLAWESLCFMIGEPVHALFTITPMTQADIDAWDGPPFSSFESFEPWPGPSLEELRQELEVANKLLADRNAVLRAIPACPDHGDQCVSHAMKWIEAHKRAEMPADEQYIQGYSAAIADSIEQINQMKRRPMTNAESEAFTALIGKQDELNEAKQILKQFMRGDPDAKQRAIQFLKPKPLNIIADGDE